MRANEFVTDAINPSVVNPSKSWSKNKTLPNNIKLTIEWVQSGELYVGAYTNGQLIGSIKFVTTEDGEDLYSKTTFIEPEYRGRGIAKEMYKFVHELGNDIRPSFSLSDAGRDMWKQFRKGKVLPRHPEKV